MEDNNGTTRTTLKIKLQRASLLKRKGMEKEKQRKENGVELSNLKELSDNKDKAETYFDVRYL
jgi:hypothetical protein